ncbi:hypothetical protein AGOR_G00081260 [Albula goreensis]|uniref:DOMON domain-containing protein n=1 Tax=Albula goreensis TaxID=1534307 RepID=A0A8T3DI97_9TELE|nr:hypothetical protein AGOR_G00081260 [Albula goreensis]
MSSWLLFYTVLVWVLRSRVRADGLLPFMVHLDPDQNVTLRWGFDQPKNEITMELTVKTEGWVGLGFSPNGGMAGADIVIGGVFPNRSTYFSDRHAVGNSLPLVDRQQSYTLLSLNEANGQTAMRFQRALQTCDNDDVPISTSPIKLIYAFGWTDEIRYHSSRRGTKEINLLQYSPRTSPQSTTFFDIRANNFTIPPKHTHYHCWIVKIPTLGAKHHIYRIEPIIRHVDIVHHILLYGCHPTVNSTTDGMCYTSSVLSTLCLTVMSAWAIGGEAIDFPEAAGVSVGGDDDISYYRLEIHYNNPQELSDLVDDSGLRFHYTSQLRQYDAAVLDVGLFVNGNYVLPPKATAFKSYGMCNTSHFQQLLKEPMPDLTAFMVLLHTHLAGRKIRVGQFRNGEQIDFLGLNENYDFNLQQATILGQMKTIKEGDGIVVECTYDTANRSGLTTFGLSTTNEMCFAFILYYPAIDISTCWSEPDFLAIEAAMGAANHQEAVAMYEAMTWNEENIKKHQNRMKDSLQVLAMGSSQNFTVAYGRIPTMKATPTVDCRSAMTPTGSGVGLSLPRPMMLLWAVVLLAP